MALFFGGMMVRVKRTAQTGLFPTLGSLCLTLVVFLTGCGTLLESNNIRVKASREVSQPASQPKGCASACAALDTDFANRLESGSRRWEPSWSRALESALARRESASLLSAEIQVNDPEITSICPRYMTLDRSERVVFWRLLFASMALHESSFNPKSLASNDGGGNDSIGLLQLSYEDESWAASWGCDIDRQDPLRQLTRPEANLSCGVAIMARQIQNHAADERKIFLERGSSYWAVLEPAFLAKHSQDNVVRTFLKHREALAPVCLP